MAFYTAMLNMNLTLIPSRQPRERRRKRRRPAGTVAMKSIEPLRAVLRTSGACQRACKPVCIGSRGDAPSLNAGARMRARKPARTRASRRRVGAWCALLAPSSAGMLMTIFMSAVRRTRRAPASRMARTGPRGDARVATHGTAIDRSSSTVMLSS